MKHVERLAFCHDIIVHQIQSYLDSGGIWQEMDVEDVTKCTRLLEREKTKHVRLRDEAEQRLTRIQQMEAEESEQILHGDRESRDAAAHS